ncbi:MAG: hypothetical protein LBC41_17715 [Clostridiales bacterium]|jgi:hypothetical protein|nr:hypothetical protein [Clostridiales bacterium]
MAKRLLAAILATCLLLSVSACSEGLSGAYKSQGTLIPETVTFFKDKTLSLSAFGLNISGAFEVKSDKIAITYEVLGAKLTLEKSFSRSGDSVFIDGVEFVKE